MYTRNACVCVVVEAPAGRAPIHRVNPSTLDPIEVSEQPLLVLSAWQTRPTGVQSTHKKGSVLRRSRSLLLIIVGYCNRSN